MMDTQNEKWVMIIDENLPLGLIANTAAIMGITLGKENPGVVDFSDPAQSCHTYQEYIENLK